MGFKHFNPQPPARRWFPVDRQLAAGLRTAAGTAAPVSRPMTDRKGG